MAGNSLPAGLKNEAPTSEDIKEEMEARGGAAGGMLEKILGWAEGAYADLLWLEPTYVEQYEGCDDAGMTIRRYAIAEPPEAKEEASTGAGQRIAPA